MLHESPKMFIEPSLFSAYPRGVGMICLTNPAVAEEQNDRAGNIPFLVPAQPSAGAAAQPPAIDAGKRRYDQSGWSFKPKMACTIMCSTDLRTLLDEL